jgi:hypothetical protein
MEEIMLKFHVIQAEQGDSLLLEWDESGKSHFILVDGGPGGVFDAHIKGFLARKVKTNGKIDRVMLSHVDDDHINGLLDFLGDLQSGQEKYKIDGLWHNTFSQVVGREIERQFFELVDRDFSPREAEFLLNKDRSIAQGDQLTVLGSSLGIKINPELEAEQLFTVDGVKNPLSVSGIKFTVVGPTEKNLEKLRKSWLAWLAKRNKEISQGIAPRALDTSVPNLSSIMMLVEAFGKTILLTGDGRGDHLLQGLRAVGLLKKGGTYHVDVLKMPHHGSARNVNMKFFQTVTADRYVISANGRDGNPDLDTLVWIAQAARDSGRKIEIVVTNESESTRTFRSAFPADQYGYTWISLPSGGNAITLDLTADINTPTITFDTSKAKPTQPEVTPEKPTKIEVTKSEGVGGIPSSKRALLVGINEFPTSAWRLRGCVNDSEDMKDLLTSLYKFNQEEIHVINDKDATGKNIREQLDWLLSDYAGGDVRLFAFSSHGTQVDDQSGDEWECQDEVIVPYDHTWANPFRDDDLKLIFDRIPDGVNFTFIADCCHSGSIQKDVLQNVEEFLPRFVSPPPEIQDRIIALKENRDVAADAYASQELMNLLKDVPQEKWIEKIPEFMALLRSRFRENRFGLVQAERHILLAGCEDKQTSADARIEGTYRGAFTWSLTKTIRESNGGITYEDAIRLASGKLRQFTQKPQLECPNDFRNLKMFAALK